MRRDLCIIEIQFGLGISSLDHRRWEEFPAKIYKMLLHKLRKEDIINIGSKTA